MSISITGHYRHLLHFFCLGPITTHQLRTSDLRHTVPIMASPAPSMNRPCCAEHIDYSDLNWSWVASIWRKYSLHLENQGYRVTQCSLSYHNISPLHIEYMLWDSVRHTARRQSGRCSCNNSLWDFRMRPPPKNSVCKSPKSYIQIYTPHRKGSVTPPRRNLCKTSPARRKGWV